MTIERTDMGIATVLRLQGDLDERGVDKLRDTLFECISSDRQHLVINLRDVGVISYMGLGVLVERLRTVRGMDGDMKLVGVNLAAERLFRMVGITTLFETYDSEASAIAVYQEAA
jgi:anti-sigma B factor antagonist